MADDRKRFAELAEEIIARIEETEGPEWWSAVSQLSAELENMHRRIFPESEYNEPKWPAFYVTSVYRDSTLQGIAAEFSDCLKRPFDKGNLLAYGVMLSYCPKSLPDFGLIIVEE